MLSQANAMRIMHEQKIMHLDIKPDNVCVGRTASGGAGATLIDFTVTQPTRGHKGTRPPTDMLVPNEMASFRHVLESGEPALRVVRALGCFASSRHARHVIVFLQTSRRRWI